MSPDSGTEVAAQPDFGGRITKGRENRAEVLHDGIVTLRACGLLSARPSSLKCDARKCSGDNDAQLCHGCFVPDGECELRVRRTILWSDNGHYYEFHLPEPDVVVGARARGTTVVRIRMVPGGQSPLAGYLVTITSAQEQAFLNQHFGQLGTVLDRGGRRRGRRDVALERRARNRKLADLHQLEIRRTEQRRLRNSAGDQAVANYGGIGLWNDWLGFVSTNFVVESRNICNVAGGGHAGAGSIGLLVIGLAGLALRRRRTRS